MRRGRALALAILLAVTAACSADDTPSRRAERPTGPSVSATGGTTTGVPLRLETVVGGLDTVWSLAFDPAGDLWWTERAGRLTRLGSEPTDVAGVAESGEGGLMGLVFDRAGRPHLMYTGRDDNRVVRLDGDRQTVLVEGIPRGGIHNGGRLLFGPDGALFVSTGDTADRTLPQRPDSLAGKVLRLDGGRPPAAVHSRGHRNVQGLCFDGMRRLLATEHGPDRGDELAVVSRGGDGGWPATSGNGLKSYTPTIAPAGCAFYDRDVIPQWRGSLFFVTLKEEDLRRITLRADGSVGSEEVLYDGELGRLRDVAVGPDGFLYLATSNRDGRGNGSADRIVRIRPA